MRESLFDAIEGMGMIVEVVGGFHGKIEFIGIQTLLRILFLFSFVFFIFENLSADCFNIFQNLFLIFNCFYESIC